MSAVIYLITLGVMFGTILTVFGMHYAASVRQAQAKIAAENAYRELAEKAVAVQSGNAASLTAMQTELTEIATRLAAVEKILKAVE
jgi:Tfp pilus assembly protein PilO